MKDGDLYPYNGNTSFTDDSRPAAKDKYRLKLGKPVTNIEQDNGDYVRLYGRNTGSGCSRG